MNYEELVMQVISEHERSPIDLLNIGVGLEEIAYLKMLKDTYTRTVQDIDSLLGSVEKNGKILEIGSLYGVVSKSLKIIGYSVFAQDIPEFVQSTKLRSFYEEAQIPLSGINLRKSTLPYESNYFDAVILCEVIEHFNFNPLPSILEINRVLKPGGLLYIGTPNLASIKNRYNLLMGRSIRNSIEDYFHQLDPQFNYVVSLHWREYTIEETVEMVEKMGFRVFKKYFFAETNTPQSKLSTRIKKRIAYSVPSLRPFQVVIAKKDQQCDRKFWYTEANT